MNQFFKIYSKLYASSVPNTHLIASSRSGIYTGRAFWGVFVCLFVCLGLSSHSSIFNSYGDVSITCTGEGLQFFTYAWHSWPLSSEVSLACHTNCDTGLYNGHLRGPVTLTTIAERLAVELSLHVFTA